MASRPILSHAYALALMRDIDAQHYFLQPRMCSLEIPPTLPPASEIAAAKRRLNITPEVLVSLAAARHKLKNCRCHLCTYELPAGALLALGDSFRCVSPLLLPVLLARSYTTFELVMLLSELMGTYALLPKKESELSGLVQKNGVFTNKSQYCSFLSALGPMPGVRAVRKALELAPERAASPREAELYLRATLGFSAGGYGLKQVLVNEELDVKSFSSAYPGLRVRKPDLLLAAPTGAHGAFKAVAVEYNGAWHDRSEQVRSDDLRRNELIAAGINVYVIWNDTYHNLNAMDAIFDAIRRDLGLPKRKLSKKQAAYEREARVKLLRELNALREI